MKRGTVCHGTQASTAMLYRVTSILSSSTDCGPQHLGGNGDLVRSCRRFRHHLPVYTNPCMMENRRSVPQVHTIMSSRRLIFPILTIFLCHVSKIDLLSALI